MSEPERVTAEEVYGKSKSGKAFLVCAYEDETKFKAMRLEGAISLMSSSPSFPRWQRIRRSFFTEADMMRKPLPVRQTSIRKWVTRM